MNTLKKTSLIGLITLLSACGGGGGDSTPTPAEPAKTISGKPAKGILINALVTAFPITNGLVDGASPLGSASTDSNGDYSIELPNTYSGGPILIRAFNDPMNPTFMRCDIPSGCDNGINFGDDYEITDPDFALDAIINGASGSSVTVNPTPLTNLGAALALDELSSLGTINDFTVSEAIANSNSQIADLFGITGQLTAVATIDLTDSTELASALASSDDELIEYATINAAIIAATMDDDASSVEEALASFVDDFIANGGIASNTSDDSETSFEDIYSFAQSVLQAVADSDLNDEIDANDFTGLDNLFAVNEADASDDPVDAYDAGTSSPTANAATMTQVKAFVSDLRDLTTAISGSQISTGESIEELADNFTVQLRAAEMASGDDLEAILSALGAFGNAIEETYDAYTEDDTLTSYTANNDIDVGIVNQNDTLTLSVDQLFEGVVLDLRASIASSLSETETGDDPELVNSGSIEFSGTASLIFDLSGSATITDNLSLTINPNSGIAIGASSYEETFTFEYLANSITEDYTGTISVGGLNITIDATIEQLTGDDPITFEGLFDIGLAASLSEYTESFQEQFSDTFNWSDSYEEDISLTDANVELHGSFTSASGEHFSAIIASDFDLIINLSETNGDVDSIESTLSNSGFNVFFNANLAGITDTVSFIFSAYQMGEDSGEIAVDISYPGHQIYIDALGDDSDDSGSLSIENQDGVTITIEENNGSISGAITIDEIPYATIEDGDIPLIRYDDGTFESL